jgi:hypothetical protein
MNVTETREIDFTATDALGGPAFIPLADVALGAVIQESQSVLHLEGAGGPLTVQVLHAPSGTPAGPPPTEGLTSGDEFRADHYTRPGHTLLTHTPQIPLGRGVVGLVIKEGLPQGARLTGTLQTVYGAIYGPPYAY